MKTFIFALLFSMNAFAQQQIFCKMWADPTHPLSWEANPWVQELVAKKEYLEAYKKIGSAYLLAQTAAGGYQADQDLFFQEFVTVVRQREEQGIRVDQRSFQGSLLNWPHNPEESYFLMVTKKYLDISCEDAEDATAFARKHPFETNIGYAMALMYYVAAMESREP